VILPQKEGIAREGNGIGKGFCDDALEKRINHKGHEGHKEEWNFGSGD
jgi:hypothetical protein